MIATSRIGKAQARLKEARPYAVEITRVLTTISRRRPHSTIRCWSRTPSRNGPGYWWSHPTEASVARTTPALFDGPRNFSRWSAKAARRQSSTPSAEKRWATTASATGISASHGPASRSDPATRMPRRWPRPWSAPSWPAPATTAIPRRETGVDELHIVYTEFKSMMSQSVSAHRIAPMVVEYVEDDNEPHTLYSFEPDATTLFDALLPRLPDHPRVHGAARVRRIRAGITPTCDEIGQRQRRRPHQGTHARGQP